MSDNTIDISKLSPDQLEELVNSGRLSSVTLSQTVAQETPCDGVSQVVEEAAAPTVTQQSSPNKVLPEPLKTEGYDFQNPVELLFFLDDNIKEGRVVLHDWQIQYMLDFAAGGLSDERPFQSLVRACNGSGKDKYIIAPCVVWLCMAFIKARGVVTSSSGKQLDSQTCAYIDLLCQEANRKIHPNVWKINYRYYECLDTGSPIECFATDEPGKAEGFHPLEFGRKMGLFMSEAKSVPDEVNVAFNKCTGYTHRAHVSTPGLPLGHFFEYCSRSPYRKDIASISDVDPIDYIQYHVTAYDCTHLSKTYIEQMKRDLPGGEGGAAFQSQVMAEFGTTDEMVVIPYTHIYKAVHRTEKSIGWLSEKYNIGGLDLSAGGDETVLSVRNGNKLLKVIPFKFDNTQDTVRFLEEKFKENNLVGPSCYIYADAGGLGKPIIDQLRERGWHNIRYVLNQNKAFDERVYANRGSEMWFNFGKLLETGEIILVNDDKMLRQLASRYYKITDKNKHQLESKLQARAKGHPSPDRGDSVVLCFSQYKSKLEEQIPEKPYKIEEPKKPERVFTMKEWAYGDSQKTTLNPSKGRDFSAYREEIRLYNEKRKQTV